MSAFPKVAGTVDTCPTANKVQQVERVEAQTPVGQAAHVFAIQIAVNPAHLPSSALFDDANRTSGVLRGLQVDHAKLHG